jgi:Cu(I)/Ag(I) efflux system membrane fusion protein/cobalt-zinc-cadmium efflux system membrane fusion protein
MKATTSVKSVALVVGLTLALGGGYLLGTSHQDHGHETLAPEKGQTAAKAQYTCSMHPFIIREAPGACPICGMALTPIKTDKGDAASETGEIRIDSVTIQNMGVRTEKAEKRKLQRNIRTVGLITAGEDRQFSINAKIEGWVERLHINQQGQQVKKGQPLLEIYSPELVAAQQEYLLAVKNKRQLAASPYPEIAAGADRLLTAARTRLRNWDISPEQVQALEQSGQARKTLTLHSEHEGIVTSKKVLPGMRIMPGEELLQIADLSKVWIIADIYEYEIPWVKVGQAARVELPFASGQVIDGTITYLSPYLENETRTVKARIEVANPGLRLKPAMYVNVGIAAEAVANVLAIPMTAVLNSGNDRTVFVALGEGRFAPRTVTTGVRDDDGFIQILSGLADGETVVVSAQFMLDSESKLREALDKMTGPKTALPGTSDSGKKTDPKALDDLFK